MEYNKDSLIEKLKEIREMGWIKSGRSKSNVGAVGNTLEDLLDIQENNLPLANGVEWELKAQRENTTSLTTLFHNEPEPRAAKIVPAILLPKYGWPHKTKENEMSFRNTIPGNRYTDRGFKIIVDRSNERVYVEFNSQKVSSKHNEWLKEVESKVGLGPIDPLPHWTFKTLSNKTHSKLKNTFYVIAQTCKKDGKEYFKYHKVLLLEGFNFDGFLNAFEKGALYVDFDARTGHNHGTKFRLSQNCWDELFSKRTRVV